MIEKPLRPNALGLSCVENYTLSILEKHLDDISCLFCMSYLSGHYLLSEIIDKEVNLRNLSLLPRIHEVAFEHLSIVHLLSYDEAEIAGMWNKMKEEKDNIYYLVKVNSSFVSESLNANLTRDDHYICYWFNDGKNNVFNDYPYRLTQFTENEISAAYEGNIIVFEVINEVEASTRTKARLLFNNHINQLPSQTNIISFEKVTSAQIRDFLVVYKRILHRTLLYCSNFITNTNLISQNIHLVDNLLTKINVNELKRKQVIFTEDINNILSTDKMIFKLIQYATKENEFSNA
jgi:hypothetical protein